MIVTKASKKKSTQTDKEAAETVTSPQVPSAEAAATEQVATVDAGPEHKPTEVAAFQATLPSIPVSDTAAPGSPAADLAAGEEPTDPAPGFRVLGLSEAVMRAVIEAGFEAPTPIQEQAIPILLRGGDLIGQAQTGTGKTAAFALPLGDRLDPSQSHTQAIVMLPTRELCIQVAQEMHNLTKYRRLRVTPVYGGQPIDRQFRALASGAHIVVGTPGRVLDHLRRGTLKLDQVRMVVLDEADEMLNMGFVEDVEEILKSAPATRQTALFSATLPPRIAALARDYLRDPLRVTIESKRRTVAQVAQSYYEIAPSQKIEALSRILDMESPGSTILFCRTRRDVDDLGEALQTRGYEAETLHGDMNQTARDRVMSRFRSGQADLLIATDVAARGLDIDQVTHVINYDIPWDVESYIHRIGRTGRAGRSGEAITLISPREKRQLKLIERMINAPIRPARVPTAADIVARRRDLFKDRLKQSLTEGGHDDFLITVQQLCSEGECDASQVAAAALQMLWLSQKGAGDYNSSEVAVEAERTEPGLTHLFLQIGRIDGIRPGDIVGAIANEAGVPGSAIGVIDIMDRSTFVEVPEKSAAQVIEALSNTKIRGKRIFVDVAKPRQDDGYDGYDGGNRGGGDSREWQNRSGRPGPSGPRPRPPWQDRPHDSAPPRPRRRF